MRLEGKVRMVELGDGMTATELTCKELVELVTLYLEGVLPAGERLRVEEHLAGCGACRNYIDQMRKTLAACARLTEESITPEAKETLLAAFRGWKQQV